MNLRRPNPSGFTLLEVMISILLFSLVLTAIYSIWLTILKGSKIGTDASARVQRSRIALRALEDAFTTSVMYTANITNYYFYADTSGDMAAVSLVSRLPASFPGVGRYGDAIVRRVSFSVEPGPEGNELIMRQAPVLQDAGQVEPYSLVMARDVSLFLMEFLDEENGEWVMEWNDTNQIPRVVKIALGTGESSTYSSDPMDLATRVVTIPSQAVPGDIQGAMGPGAIPGQPGVPTRPGLPNRPGQLNRPGQGQINRPGRVRPPGNLGPGGQRRVVPRRPRP